jgi:hypothetical protein
LGPANIPLPNNYQAIEFSKCANGIILNNSQINRQDIILNNISNTGIYVLNEAESKQVRWNDKKYQEANTDNEARNGKGTGIYYVGIKTLQAYLKKFKLPS